MSVIRVPFGQTCRPMVAVSCSRLKTNIVPLALSANRLYSSHMKNATEWSSNKTYYDIIIAGGGMVGCAMACKLSKESALRGSSILLLEGGPRKEYNLDAKQNVSNKSYSNRVSALSKSSVQLLQSVGAWQTIKDIGGYNVVKEMRIWNYGGGRNGGVNNMLTFDNENDLAYIVENDVILGALYKQIDNDQNIIINYGSRVDQCSSPGTHKDLATVKVANRDTIFETSLLIGSDGYGSKVRPAIAGQQYISWEYKQRAIVATLSVQPNKDDVFNGHVAWQKFARLGPVALLPLDSQTCSLVWTTSIEEAQRLIKLSDNEFVKALNDVLSEERESSNGGLILANDAVRIMSTILNKLCKLNNNNQQSTVKSILPIVTGISEGSRGSFPLGFGHANQYVDHRIALVGDAAHRVHPLAGQGVNLGFGDVAELSDRLNKSVISGCGIGDLNTLLNYESAAQRRNVPIMLGIDGIQKVFGSNNTLIPSTITALVRNAGLSFGQSTSLIKKLLSDKASGLPA